jgi:hypothetical protein
MCTVVWPSVAKSVRSRARACGRTPAPGPRCSGLRRQLTKAGVAASSLGLTVISGSDPVAQTRLALASGSGLVLEPAFRIEVGGVGFTVRPDAVVVPTSRARDSEPVVAEVKSFRDRGPMTEPSRVDSAMGQLAVGQAAVAQVLPEAATSGVLVMASPGKGFRAHRMELSRWDRHLRLLWPALAAAVSRGPAPWLSAECGWMTQRCGRGCRGGGRRTAPAVVRWRMCAVPSWLPRARSRLLVRTCLSGSGSRAPANTRRGLTAPRSPLTPVWWPWPPPPKHWSSTTLR